MDAQTYREKVKYRDELRNEVYFVIDAHELAFAYYGGMTKEIVYDQDHLLLVSENYGNLILTHEFAVYVRSRGFQVHMCRKQDPESKGRIENVVKYVKRNFARHSFI